MARVFKFGDQLNTDDILPGKYAPFMVGEEYYRYAFAHLRPDFAATYRPGDLVVAGRNTGLGSSREYAPEALKKLGVPAIIAVSYARIFFRNLVNLGIVPFEAPEIVEVLQDGDEVELELTSGVLKRGEEVFQLKPPAGFLAEALREGSLFEYYRRHQRFPGG